MRQKLMMVAMAFAGGIVSLGAFKLFFDQNTAAMQSGSMLPVYSANYAPLPLDGTLDFTAASERTVNSVVHVKTQMSMKQAYNPWMDFFGYQQQDQVQMSSGSGVIISPDGYIITNNHVVEGADKLSVTLNNNKNYEAKVIGRDPSTDIAVIKIEEKNLPAVIWGNSEDVKIGQWVIAVGNPFDLTSTVTAGIVSAKARNINLLGGNGQNGNEEIFPVESFIQTDAAVNPGNSGGALVNTRGELVGVNTAIASRSGTFSGYAFAVPATIARKVAQDLIEFGHVQRAFIGVQITDVTQEKADELDLKEVSGIYVKSLTEGGAAADSGIQEGDVIQKVGEINVKNVPELQEQVSKFRPGDKIKVGVWRDGKQQVVDVTLRNRSGKAQLEDFSAAASESSFESLGAKFSGLSIEDKSSLKIQGGAKITDIQAGKFKSLGMQKGFIITRVGDTKINSPEDLKSALEGKEGSYVEIRGMYANGMEAMYGFRL
ncbi:MAG: trypsin-like peptidase domain-containing protein [Flavobacteriales bacterium]